MISALCAGAGAAHAGPGALPEGEAAAQLEITRDLNRIARGGSWTLAPDAWLGAGDDVTVGVVHAGPELDRFQPDYLGGGIDVLWQRWAHLAPRARVLVRDTDPWKPALALGALAQWRHGGWTLTADPYVLLGLENQAQGNRSELWLPVAVAFAPTWRWAVDVRTGWSSRLRVIADGDDWHVPLWLGARAHVTPHVELGAAVAFYSLAGPQNDVAERALFFTASWASTHSPR